VIKNDTGILHDLLNIFRREYYEDKKRGQQSDPMLLGVGTCMTAIGVMMSLSAFNLRHGECKGWSR
jgi:hypothetical protein